MNSFGLRRLATWLLPSTATIDVDEDRFEILEESDLEDPASDVLSFRDSEEMDARSHTEESDIERSSLGTLSFRDFESINARSQTESYFDDAEDDYGITYDGRYLRRWPYICCACCNYQSYKSSREGDHDSWPEDQGAADYEKAGRLPNHKFRDLRSASKASKRQRKQKEKYWNPKVVKPGYACVPEYRMPQPVFWKPFDPSTPTLTTEDGLLEEYAIADMNTRTFYKLAQAEAQASRQKCRCRMCRDMAYASIAREREPKHKLILADYMSRTEDTEDT